MSGERASLERILLPPEGMEVTTAEPDLVWEMVAEVALAVVAERLPTHTCARCGATMVPVEWSCRGCGPEP